MLSRPLQPQFKIRVFNGKSVQPDTLKSSGVIPSTDGNYIDIEPCVAYPVTYEEDATLISKLSFTVDKHAEVLLYYFFIGQSIIFYGGHYEDNQEGMRHVFSGTVTRIKTSFSDSGIVTFRVECMNYGFIKFGKDYKFCTYPDKRSERKFAQKDSLTIEDIVRGIADENKFNVGTIDLTPAARKMRFDKNDISYQRKETDWAYLNRIARDVGCYVWISTENGTDYLNFASKSKAMEKQASDISFVYPLQGKVTELLDSDIQKFPFTGYDRPRILRDVNVDEDMSLANSVTRSAVYYDKETGEAKDVVAKMTVDSKGKNQITFYELDEKRVEWVDQHLPNVAEAIRNGSPTALEWGTPDNPNCASYYYKKITIIDEKDTVFDKAFYGITVTARCNQDLNIISQRSYRIRGILSYHSSNPDTSFYLRGLKHIWAKDGNWTELDFIR